MLRRSFLRVAISAATLTNCSKSRAPLRKTRVAATFRRSVAPLYLAAELGFFREAGLDAEIGAVPEGNASVPLLAGGDIDVAVGGLYAAVVNAAAQGARIRVVAGREIASPDCGSNSTLFVRRSAFPNGVRDLKLLRGKRIALHSRTSTWEFRLEAMLNAANMKWEDVEVQHLRRPEAVAALLSGKVDAMLDHDADKQLNDVSREMVPGIRFAQVLPGFQHSFVMFGKSFLDRERDAGVRFLSAYLRGCWAFLDGKTPKYLIDYAISNKLDVDAMRTQCRETFEPNGDIHTADIDTFVGWAVRRGYCAKAVPARDLMDTHFLAEAHSRIGRRAPKSA